MQMPAVGCPSQRVVALFGSTVSRILKKQEHLAEENLLGFAIRDAMLQVLAAIAGIPLKPFDRVKGKHGRILLSYTRGVTKDGGAPLIAERHRGRV